MKFKVGDEVDIHKEQDGEIFSSGHVITALGCLEGRNFAWVSGFRHAISVEYLSLCEEVAWRTDEAPTDVPIFAMINIDCTIVRNGDVTHENKPVCFVCNANEDGTFRDIWTGENVGWHYVDCWVPVNDLLKVIKKGEI